MATVRRVGLFSREVREHLSLAGVEVLLGRVSKLSEGQLQADGRYYGSTMLTLDLGQLEATIRDACDVSTGKRLVRLMSENEAAAAQVRQIACAEATALAGRPLRIAGVDVRMRCDGSWLFVDIDVEATLAVPPGEALAALVAPSGST